MSNYNISWNCIKLYIAQYDLILKETRKFDKYGIEGDLRLYQIENTKEKQIGHLHFNVDYEYKDLYINIVWIKIRDKHNIPIKLFKVMLLYLISTYQDEATIISLKAKPSKDRSKRGTEFCLPCYYQRLGFEPVDIDVKTEIQKCKRQIKKCDPNYKEQYNMCLLCHCQRLSIPLETKLNLDYLEVDMKVVLSRMKVILKETYDKICS